VAIAIGATVASNGTSGAPGRVDAGPVHVPLADFSVDTNPGGTVTVTLSQAQMLDPDGLRQALAQAGVPAKITPDSFCYNPVPRPGRALEAFALSRPGPGEASHLVITLSKLPAGSTLAIGYAHPPRRRARQAALRAPDRRCTRHVHQQPTARVQGADPGARALRQESSSRVMSDPSGRDLCARVMAGE